MFNDNKIRTIKRSTLKNNNNNTNNTFHKEMHNFIIFFQLFAIAPFSKNSLYNYLLIIYSFCSLFAIIMIFISGIFINDVIQENSLSALVGGLQFFGLILTHMIIVVQAFLTRQNQMEIIDKLTEIDNIFQNKLYIEIPYNKIRRKYVIKNSIIICILIIIKLYFIITLLISESSSNYYWLHCYYSILVIRLRCIQNMFYVDMIRDRLDYINEKLTGIVYHTKKNDIKFILLMDDDKYQYRRGRKRNQQYPNNNNNNDDYYNSINTKGPTYEQIIILKQIYGKIWDICNLINDSFGWSLLAITTQYFIDFTSNSYYLFLAIANIVPDDTAMDSICLLIPIVFQLSILAYSCYKCSQSVSFIYVY